MTDFVNVTKRYEFLSRIQRCRTVPGILVCRIADELAFRLRLHYADLSDSPDMGFLRCRTVLLVHGCFWNRHDGCLYSSVLKSWIPFWTKKLEENVAWDARIEMALHGPSW